MKHALSAGSVMQVLRQQAGVWSMALVAGATGCAAQGAPTAAVQQAPAKTTAQGWRQLGYFVLVDGTIGVTDMQGFEVVQSIKVGHYGVHQVAVMADNRTIYTGNRDDNTLVKIVVSEDGKTHTVKSLGKSPVDLHLFANTPDNRYVVITSRLELEDTVVATTPTLPNDSIAILDTQTDTIVKTVALQSPAMVAFPKDGKTMYVNNVHHASVSVIDTATWSVKATWPVADAPLAPLPTGEHRVAPDGLDVSPDGKWVATADYDLGTVTVWEAANPANKRHISYGEGNGLPHDVRFSPASDELWVTDYDRHPVPADEVGNAKIKTKVRVFDVASLKESRKFELPRMVQRIALPQYAKEAYLTTGIGGVLMIDRQTGALQGEVVLGGLGRPVVCGMTSY